MLGILITIGAIILVGTIATIGIIIIGSGKDDDER